MTRRPITVPYAAPAGRYRPWLFRCAVAWSILTLFNLFAGGSVTSHGAGLAVPDWPTTYDQNMFTFPLRDWWMKGGIFYEHGHRLVASAVGMMTIVMVVLIALYDERRWLRRLSYVALAAVITQGILGGLTVRFFLPKPVSIGHAGLAQLFFGLTAAMALFLSRGWLAAPPTAILSGGAWKLCIAAACMIYVQTLLGAVVRHTQSGLAITDFPASYGGWFPPLDAAAIERINAERAWGEHYAVLKPVTANQILLHYAHRVNAVLTAMIVAAAAVVVLRREGGAADWLRGPA